MSTKHTPGPWTIVGAEHAHTIVGAKYVIADVFCPDEYCASPETDEEALSNACLIAAAPDLLAALEAAEGALSSFVDGNPQPDLRACDAICDMARAAIAKAGGRA